MKLNGEAVDVLPVVILPAPFSVTVTDVALPPKVFPLTVIGEIPHVLPLVLLKVSVGEFTQPQLIFTVAGADVQPVVIFLAIIEAFPLAKPVNNGLAWYAPPFKLYSKFAPVGFVTCILPFPNPKLQSTVATGVVGKASTVAITAVLLPVVQPFNVAST